MDLNRFSYYRANPFANNDFIPVASMTNRKKKQFPSEIPQGQEYLSSKPGKRIFRDKVQSNEIQKDNIFNSPERYPFENRIALQKTYSRNLDTIDIQGAASGTKVSESIRNKHKALQQLRRRNQQQVKSPLIGGSLDQVYEKKRRQLAEQIQKTIQMKKTKQNSFQNSTNNKSNEGSLQDSRAQKNNVNSMNLSQSQLQAQYERYVSHNSNQKYNGAPHSYEFQGFQRYKRPQGSFQTLDSYNNGRIPEQIPLRKQYSHPNRYSSIDNSRQLHKQQISQMTNYRGSSVQNSLNSSNLNLNKQSSYMNNSYINMNNRHRSNPEYIENYASQLQKRIQQTQKNKQIQENIKSIYQTDRNQFRRHNPTNLSFNIAAKSSLMGPIV